MPYSTLEALKALEPTMGFQDLDMRSRATCLHCRSTLLVCSCATGASGIDCHISSWGIPLLPNAAPNKQRLARFLAIRRHIPFAVVNSSSSLSYADGTGPVDWDVYMCRRSTTLLPAFEDCVPTVLGIINTTPIAIFSASLKQDVLAIFQIRMPGATANDLRVAAVRAGQVFMRMHWSTLTRFEVMLVATAIENRNREQFPSTRHLLIVEEAAASLFRDVKSWMNEVGWHVAIE
ncbi:hypothetical protein DL93DRAFT_2164203 [Clavulina sp. PMI_390]|nr:hypothetical protein DL93DRAFT_2164203 [Clavulina sp. PMI_390]